jgi:protein AroM
MGMCELSRKISKKRTVALITIGQSPRTDVTSDVADILGPDIEILECGALDNLSLEEIHKLEPTEGEELLVSRLRDGTEVRLAHERIIELVNRCVADSEKSTNVLILICTGEFPDAESNKLLITPSKVLFNIAKSLISQGKIGVLIPDLDQMSFVEKKWEREGISVVIESFSPYSKVSDEQIRRVANRFSEEKVSFIVLDCIGYSSALSRKLKELTGIPVILPRSMVARVVRELL